MDSLYLVILPLALTVVVFWIGKIREFYRLDKNWEAYLKALRTHESILEAAIRYSLDKSKIRKKYL